MAIKYGFFDAEEFEEETIEGQTVLVPDRAYSPSDMNNYFDGIISPDGIFYPYLSACSCKVLPDSDITVEEAAAHPDCFKIEIQPGIGRIRGHFFKIEAGEYVFVPHGSADGDRYDRIILRLDEGERTISAVLLSGAVVEHTSPSNTSYNTSNYSPANNPKESMAGIYDINLCQLYIGQNAATSSSVLMEDHRGVDIASSCVYCPWITHLIYTDGGHQSVEENLDTWLKKYANYIDKWFTEVVDKLEVSTTVRSYHATFTNGSGWNLGQEIEGYTFNPGDVFDVFYNGLRLRPGEYQIDETTGQFSLANNRAVTGENEVYIQILKSQVGVPSYIDGDNILY